MVRFKKGQFSPTKCFAIFEQPSPNPFVLCVSPLETMKFVTYIMFSFDIKWKSISMTQRKGEGSKDKSHMTRRLFKILKDNWRYQRASIFTCKFSVVRFIRHCCHVKIFVLKWGKWGHFSKKVVKSLQDCDDQIIPSTWIYERSRSLLFGTYNFNFRIPFTKSGLCS